MMPLPKSNHDFYLKRKNQEHKYEPIISTTNRIKSEI